MTVKLNSTGGGSVSLVAPNTASARTLTLPDNTGNLISSADSATVTPTMLSQPLTLMTAQTASGTSVDFTGIPSWVKRITLSIIDLSYAAAGTGRIRIGTSSGLVSSGYTTTTTSLTATPSISFSSVTDGLAQVNTAGAASVLAGQYVLVNITGNTWQLNGFITRPADSVTNLNVGYIALSGTLDRLSLVATTSTFDAGSINILYEG